MTLSDRITSRKAKQIYALIRRQGTVSKLDLLNQSELTVSTLTRILEELASQKLIVEVGFGESTGGRRPILYETNAAYRYVFGLDISRFYSRIVLCDMHLNKLDSRSWSMTAKMTPQVAVELFVRAVADLMGRHGITREAVLGIGIGAVGPVDRHHGVIMEPLYFPAPGWSNVDICRIMEEQLGIPATLDNGANAAILGEYWADDGHSYDHLLYVHAGIGLRSAMMTGGQLVYGAFDMEGSVGQMIIETDGVKHREKGGNYGCLESYASIYALEQAAQSRLKQGRDSRMLELAGTLEQVGFPHLLQALQEGDPLAVELFTQTATYFGIGLSNLLNVLHPQKVVLGGPLVSSHELFFRVATEVALKNAYHYPSYQVVFSKGKLGEDALAAGAAALVINKLTE